MDETFVKSNGVVTGCRRHGKLSPVQFLENARVCLKGLEKNNDFGAYGEIMVYLDLAKATPIKIGKTQKQLDIRLLEIFMHKASNALDVIDVSSARNSDAVDQFKGLLDQANNFAIEHAATLVDLKEPGKEKRSDERGFEKTRNTAFVDKLDEPKAGIIVIIKDILADADSALAAVGKSRKLKNLEAFRYHLGYAGQIALLHEQILSNKLSR